MNVYFIITQAMKIFHFIFDYNYGNFLIDFDNFLPLETGMNKLQFQFNVTTLYLVKLKITQK